MTIISFNFYVFTIGYANIFSSIIIQVAASQSQVSFTSGNSQAAQLTIYPSLVKASGFVASIVAKVLVILNTTGVGPVIIDLTIYIDTGTQTIFSPAFACCTATTVSIFITDLAGDFYIVSFFLQSSYANAQVVQFFSEFSSQSVNISAFCHCFSNDLSHFITSHQFVATEGGVAVAFDYAGSSQFVDAVICPVAGRYVRERICSISRSGYAQCHCHCEY